MVGKASPHRLIKIDPRERTAYCKACGPVKVLSAGSDRRGGTRWRCAPQAAQSKRRRTEVERERGELARAAALQARYGIKLESFCCQTLEQIDAPTCSTASGSLWDEHYMACTSCGDHYVVQIEATDDVDGTLNGNPGDVIVEVTYVVARQTYVNGVLDRESAQTAKQAYEQATTWQDDPTDDC